MVHACIRQPSGVKVSNHDRLFIQPLAAGNAGWPFQFRFAVHAIWSRVPELWPLGIIDALMKYTLPILALSIFLTACGHRSDAEIRKSLPGAWHFVMPSSNQDRSVFTISSSGDFTNDVIRPDGAMGPETSGTFQVQDGYLIATVTKSSQKGGRLPNVLRVKITRADNRVIVGSIEGMTNQITIQKDTP
jgi:hypothetical protein